MSDELEKAGIVARGQGGFSAFDAWRYLRPMAFRADLWRYMVLWMHGGIYMDAKIMLVQDISFWVNLTDDRVASCLDRWKYPVPKTEAKRSKGQRLWRAEQIALEVPIFWNALIAARPRSTHMAHVIRVVVDKIRNRFYERGGEHPDLMLTGPGAFTMALHDSNAHELVRTDCQVEAFVWGQDQMLVYEGLPWVWEDDCLKSEKKMVQSWCKYLTQNEKAGKVKFSEHLLIITNETEHQKDRSGKRQTHYTTLMENHAVYCDEPGPPCGWPFVPDGIIPNVVWYAGPRRLEGMERHNSQFLPLGTVFQWVNDAGINSMVKNISKELAFAGIIDGSFAAFLMLRPKEFRLHIWIYMVLWMYGGIYIDPSVLFIRDASEWVDLHMNDVATCYDDGWSIHDGQAKVDYQVYWSSIIAVRPRHPKLASIVRRIVKRVQMRYYPPNHEHQDLMLSGAEAFTRFGNKVSGFTRVDCQAEHQEAKTLVYKVINETKTLTVLALVNATQSDADAQWLGKRAAELIGLHIIYCDEGPACSTL